MKDSLTLDTKHKLKSETLRVVKSMKTKKTEKEIFSNHVFEKGLIQNDLVKRKTKAQTHPHRK